MKTPIEMMLDGVQWVAHTKPDIDNYELPYLPYLPYVTHSGTLEIMGIILRVYQLSSGKRVIDGDDMKRLFGVTP